jgi:hypothetical protein
MIQVPEKLNLVQKQKQNKQTKTKIKTNKQKNSIVAPLVYLTFVR